MSDATALVTPGAEIRPRAANLAAPADLPDRQLAAWRAQFFDTRVVHVSVCIANWNCRDLLRKCLESLYGAPQGVPFETIVVDNGSKDGCVTMVADDFPQVQVIRNEANLGFARANNQAARRARGRLLFFLNNDTVLPPGTLGRLAEYLDAHPEVGMVGPRLRDAAGRVQTSFRPRPTVSSLLHRATLLRWTGLCRQAQRKFRRTGMTGSAPCAVQVLMGAALLVSRSLFERIGGWDEDFEFGGEDLELCHRVNRVAPLIYLPHVEITHFGRASTRRNIAFASPKIAVGFVRYLRKTGIASERQLLVYKTIVTLDAPFQCLVKLAQYVVRLVCGRHEKGVKSLLAARAAWHFLTRGLAEFWRA